MSHHLDTQPYEARLDPLQGTKGAGARAHHATAHHLPAVVVHL